MASSIAFMCAACLIGGIALLAILRVTHLAMSSHEGIERDGLPRGGTAPTWTLPDQHGGTITSPPSRGLQLIAFTDHSLRSFPSVATGLRDLAHAVPELEIVILVRTENAIAAGVLTVLGLGELSIVTGSPKLYSQYRVRALPWLMFADSTGRVRASSLVNHDWQVAMLARIAQVPLASDAPDDPVRRGPAPVAVGG